MNIPCYTFCPENKNCFFEYLKTANKYKNSSFCDKSEYELLKDIYPLERDLKIGLQNHLNEECTVIDITGNSDEEINEEVLNKTDTDVNACQIINETAVEDITHAIKENLDTEKSLSDESLTNLQYTLNLEDVFRSLAKELNFEAVVYFGNSLITTTSINDSVIAFYIKYLLFSRINNEYSEELEFILKKVSQEHEDVLIEELTKYFLCTNTLTSKVLYRFLQCLSQNFQIKLLKNILYSCENLQENHLNLVETLISDHMDFDILSKLVNLLSISSDKYHSEKAFGKLVINVLKRTGKNIHLLEQPLRHIISTHKTIWRLKIQKIVEENLYNNSIYFPTEELYRTNHL